MPRYGARLAGPVRVMSKAGRYVSGALALLPIIEPIARLVGRLARGRSRSVPTPEECDREAEKALAEITRAERRRLGKPAVD